MKSKKAYSWEQQKESQVEVQNVYMFSSLLKFPFIAQLLE
jgi:hypothetical protein